MFLLKQWKREEDGYVSVEAVFIASIMMIMAYLVIAFFLVLISYGHVQQDVRSLSVMAERQGGLTDRDIEIFENTLKNYSFIDHSNEIEISLVTESGLPTMDIDPIGTGEVYVSRDSGELMVMRVETPANNKMLKPLIKVLGLEGSIESYTFKSSFYSERY
ncbi:TadE/TadG family type IV pilus assembly protein [Psychrobacillus sp. FSL K6-1464]|uniref:TadE/TadG family type IV pilus assembly protein n=1 Tax=Psychrobacillus sp. FSL K6-1464 TaxID=2921545 RepID=UPI0030FB1849